MQPVAILLRPAPTYGQGSVVGVLRFGPLGADQTFLAVAAKAAAPNAKLIALGSCPVKTLDARIDAFAPSSRVIKPFITASDFIVQSEKQNSRSDNTIHNIC